MAKKRIVAYGRGEKVEIQPISHTSICAALGFHFGRTRQSKGRQLGVPPVVSIRLDFDADDWLQKAVGQLKADAELYGAPRERLVEIEEQAREAGLELVAQEEPEGWRIVRRKRSTPEGDTEEGSDR